MKLISTGNLLPGSRILLPAKAHRETRNEMEQNYSDRSRTKEEKKEGNKHARRFITITLFIFMPLSAHLTEEGEGS